MSKVKVLLLIDWFLPGYRAGGPIRSMANMIEALKDSMSFTVITRDRDYQSDTPYANVGLNQPQLLSGVTVYYLKPEELSIATFKRLAHEIDYNVLYINGMYSLWFSILPLIFLKNKNIRALVSPRGMLSEGSIGVKSFQKKVYLSFAKWTRLYSSVVFHCSNPEEERATKQIFGSTTKTTAITNFSKATSPIQELGPPADIGLRLFQVARISPEKNQLKALEILRDVHHPVAFNLYGPIYNEAYWGQCLEAIAQLPSNISVKWHGAIEPEKMEAVIAAHHALFLPTTGENFGHIIAETLSAGRPVLISNKTPWLHLQDVNAGYSIDLANNADFVAAIQALTQMDANQFKTSCVAAQEYYSEQTKLSDLKAAYLQLFKG